MIKRILAGTLAAVLLVSLAACGGGTTGASDSSGAAEEPTSASSGRATPEPDPEPVVERTNQTLMGMSFSYPSDLKAEPSSRENSEQFVITLAEEVAAMAFVATANETPYIAGIIESGATELFSETMLSSAANPEVLANEIIEFHGTKAMRLHFIQEIDGERVETDMYAFSDGTIDYVVTSMISAESVATYQKTCQDILDTIVLAL